MDFPFKEKIQEVFTSRTKWYKKYPWFMLFCSIFFVTGLIPAFIEEGLSIPKTHILSTAVTVLILANALFFLMIAKDKIKLIQNIFLKVFTYILFGLASFISIVLSCIWIISWFNL